MDAKLVFDPSKFDGDMGHKEFVIPEAGSQVALVVRRDTTEWRKSKRTGNEYLNIRLEVLNGPAKGYWLYYTVPTGDYMIAFLGRLLQAMGYNMNEKMEFSIDEIIGKRCEAKIRHEVNNGTNRAVINYFMKHNPKVYEIADNKASVIKTKPAKPELPDADETQEDDNGLPF